MGNPFWSYRASFAIWNHTCHPTQVNTPHLYPSQIGQYSIYLPRRDERLNWPRQLVTYRDGLPAWRQSPVKVLTRPGVEWLHWSDETRYRYAEPPTHFLAVFPACGTHAAHDKLLSCLWHFSEITPEIWYVTLYLWLVLIKKSWSINLQKWTLINGLLSIFFVVSWKFHKNCRIQLPV